MTPHISSILALALCMTCLQPVSKCSANWVAHNQSNSLSQLWASYGELHQVLRRSFWDSDRPHPGSSVCTIGQAQSSVCVTKDPCLEQCDHEETDLEKMVNALRPWEWGWSLTAAPSPSAVGTFIGIHTHSHRTLSWMPFYPTQPPSHACRS